MENVLVDNEWLEAEQPDDFEREKKLLLKRKDK